MLDSAPLVMLGFAYFFYSISKEFEDQIKNFLLFLSLLFIPLACFVTGGLIEEDPDLVGSIIPPLFYNTAYILFLIIILMFSLFTFNYLTELKVQKGKVKL